MSFLKDLLTLRTEWVDKGQGHYVVRRRLHPAARFLLALLLLGIGAALGLWFIRGSSQPRPPVIIPAPQALASRDVVPLSEDLEAVVSRDSQDSQDSQEPDLIVTSEPVPMPSPGGRNFWVRISKGDYTLSLYQGKELVKVYEVATGKNPGNKRRVGDHRTPVGNFRILSIEDSSSWKHDFGDGNGQIPGAYGPWFLRLDAGGWRGIGIHGTHDPDSLGTSVSEGCVRMRNDDLRELRRYAFRGMRVVIQE